MTHKTNDRAKKAHAWMKEENFIILMKTNCAATEKLMNFKWRTSKMLADIYKGPSTSTSASASEKRIITPTTIVITIVVVEGFLDNFHTHTLSVAVESGRESYQFAVNRRNLNLVYSHLMHRERAKRKQFLMGCWTMCFGWQVALHSLESALSSQTLEPKRQFDVRAIDGEQHIYCN